ncbi:MAG: PorT family protein [Prevotella sp.]|nr:PorT family protein [Prevotella sp.]
MTRRTTILLMMLLMALMAMGQTRKVQNKPYIDLRPLHFGISIGLNLQDVTLQNVGPQLMEDGTLRTIVCDDDTWNPGFSVGVLADLRLSQHFALRFTPQMHFGSKHLVFRDFDDLNDGGHPRESTQDMKNTYLAVPIDLKFSAERFNNYRPYLIGGISPMINLTGKDQEFVQLNRFDSMVEVGMGCDFYLPFFKLIPEIKFCYGLTNSLNKGHVDELTDVNMRVFSNSIDKAHASMFLFTLYFE